MHSLNAQDLQNLTNYNVDQFEMCEKIFDFTEGPANNGWTIEPDKTDGPYTVTCNSDGKQFVVGEGFCEEIPEMKSNVDRSTPPIPQADMDRFDSIVSDDVVIKAKNKRYSKFVFLMLTSIH